MALTSSERHDVRYGSRLGYQKATIDAAAQAIADAITAPSVQSVLRGAIDAATQPFGVQLTGSERTRLIAYVMRTLFDQDKDG